MNINEVLDRLVQLNVSLNAQETGVLTGFLREYREIQETDSGYTVLLELTEPLEDCMFMEIDLDLHDLEKVPIH